MRARDSEFDEPIITIMAPPGTPDWLKFVSRMPAQQGSSARVEARAPKAGPAWEEVFHHRGWDFDLKRWRSIRQKSAIRTGVPAERDIVEQISDDFLKQIRGEPFYPSYRAERLYEAATVYIVKPPGSGKNHLVGSIHGYYVKTELAVRDLFSMVKILHQGSPVWLADFKTMKLDRVLTLWELLMLGDPEKAEDGMRFMYAPDVVGYVKIGKKKLWPVSEAQWKEGQMAPPEQGGPLHVPGLYENDEARDYPDLEASLLGAQSRLDATHAVGAPGPGMRVFSPTSHGFFVHRLERGGGSLHWFKAPAVGELPDAARMIHELLQSPGFDIERLAPSSMRRAAEPGKMAAMAQETFKVARKRLLDGLAARNWAVKPFLKVPQAVSPEGAMHLFFKSQAIYQVDKDGAAQHSLTSDMRGLSVDDLIAAARRHHELFEKGAEEKDSRPDRVAAEFQHAEARRIAAAVGVDWYELAYELHTNRDALVDEFTRGLNIEYEEHADVVKGDPNKAALIALAHLKEDPHYYTKLKKAGLEAGEAEALWCVTWINPTTNKRQIYFDELTERTAQVEARTLRMHHPNADVRVERCGADLRKTREGGEPLAAEEGKRIPPMGHPGTRPKSGYEVSYHHDFEDRSLWYRTEDEAVRAAQAISARHHSFVMVYKLMKNQGDGIVAFQDGHVYGGHVDRRQGRPDLEVDESPRGGEPLPSEANEAREDGLADPAVPWIKVTRDPEQYAEAMKLAAAHGPIDDARDVYDLLSPGLSKEDQEVFIVVSLDVRSQLRGVTEVHRGGRSHVGVDSPDVMRAVLQAGGESFIVVHNHPSGKAVPSKADRELTEALNDAAKSNDLALRDHVIIGMGQYFSFAKDKLYRVKS